MQAALLTITVYNLDHVDGKKHAFFHPHDPNYKQLLLEERLAPLQSKLIKKGHKCQTVTDWSEGFILCTRKKNKIYDAYADIRSYKSQIFQAQALAW